MDRKPGQSLLHENSGRHVSVFDISADDSAYQRSEVGLSFAAGLCQTQADERFKANPRNIQKRISGNIFWSRTDVGEVEWDLAWMISG